MFRVQSKETGKTYRRAVIGLLLFSATALAITIWVMVDFLREQSIVEELIEKLPADARGSAEVLAGELRWQFRLTILVVLNVVVTGFALVLLLRAYRLSQESLRDFKALAGDILSSMDQAVITTDLDGRITSINRRGLELLTPEAECVGQSLQVLSAIPLDDFRSDWLVERSVSMIRDFHKTGNGNNRILRAFCQTLSDFAGNEVGNVLQVRDVTKRVLVDERLRRMERYMGLGSLAVGLHHEIKNPLAALSLHVQLLEEQIEAGETSSEIQQMLAVIKAEVTRVGGVLEGFRDFAAIDELNFELVNLNELIQRQVHLLTPRLKRAQVTVQVSHAADIPKVMVDYVRLEQVLLNLLLNAIDAMPDGGSVTISTRATEGGVEIQVRDTGCGIPADLQDRILDPYFTTKSNGTGLGLALCDKIVRQHCGSLDFHSTETGTTVNIVIPFGQKSTGDANAKRT